MSPNTHSNLVKGPFSARKSSSGTYNLHREMARRKRCLLFNLPAELVIEIFSYLEPTKSHEAIDCLTMSRAWYEYSWPVTVRDLHLTADKLVHLTHDPAILDKIHPHVTTVTLSIDGYENFATHGSLSVPDTFYILDVYHTRLNHSMERLFSMLRQSPRLKSIKLEVREVEFPPRKKKNDAGLRTILARAPWKVGRNSSQVSWSNPCRLLIPAELPRQLTSLTLDADLDYLGFGPKGSHMCAIINSQLLRGLRSLRLRLRNLCPDLLQVPEDGPKLKLEEIIISTDIPENPAVRGRFSDEGHTRACFGHRHNNWQDVKSLRKQLEKQLHKLAGRMEKPKSVVLIYVDEFRAGPWALNVLTGQRLYNQCSTKGPDQGSVGAFTHPNYI